MLEIWLFYNKWAFFLDAYSGIDYYHPHISKIVVL